MFVTKVTSKPSVCRIYDDKVFRCCFYCLKKILFSKNLLIVNDLEWIKQYQPNMQLVPSSGCIASVLQDKKDISQIRADCQNFIIARVTINEIHTANFE